MADSKTLCSLDEFKNFLKSKDMKATPQRLAVHAAMLELGHASADMVAEDISAKGEVSVTVASVYNTLSQLAMLGVYRHRLSANNKMYFDVTSEKHLHLYDIRNHTHKDIFDDELIEMVESHFKKKRFRGYKVDSIDIQLICHPTRKTSQK